MKGIGRIVLEEGCALPEFDGNSVLRIDNYRRNSKTIRSFSASHESFFFTFCFYFSLPSSISKPPSRGDDRPSPPNPGVYMQKRNRNLVELDHKTEELSIFRILCLISSYVGHGNSWQQFWALSVYFVDCTRWRFLHRGVVVTMICSE